MAVIVVVVVIIVVPDCSKIDTKCTGPSSSIFFVWFHLPRRQLNRNSFIFFIAIVPIQRHDVTLILFYPLYISSTTTRTRCRYICKLVKIINALGCVQYNLTFWSPAEYYGESITTTGGRLLLNKTAPGGHSHIPRHFLLPLPKNWLTDWLHT